jgi:hypothetical protein
VERDELETIILRDIVSIVDELRTEMVFPRFGVGNPRAVGANKNLSSTFFLAVTRKDCPRYHVMDTI